MVMRKIFLFIFLLCGCSIYAKGPGLSRPESFNFKKGLELVEQQDYSNAYDYFHKESIDNPKSGYAQYWMGYISLRYKEYGRALEAFELALKYLPSKDTPYLLDTYAKRSYIYLSMNDTVKALNELNAGIKVEPKTPELYVERADIYFYQGKYAQAESDYKKILSLNPGSVVAHMGLGRNLKEVEKYEEAIKYFDAATALDKEYVDAYAFRAESQLQLKKYDEATDNILNALLLYPNHKKTLLLMLTLKEEARQLVIPKLKVQMMKNADDFQWPFYIGEVYEASNEFKSALPYYDKALSLEFSSGIVRRLSYCYKQLGHFKNSMKYIDLASKLDSTDAGDLATKIDLYAYMYDMDNAMASADRYVKQEVDYNYAYRKRAVLKIMQKKYEEAVEDLNMAIVLAPKTVASYSHRGRCYLKLGKQSLAEADFKKVLELDPDYTTFVSAYALYFLGRTDEAFAAFDKQMKEDEKDKSGYYYNKACVYSLMNKKTEAVDFLKKALDAGFNRFHHIETDWDLDNIRDTEEYKSLLKEYKEKLEKEIIELDKIKTSSIEDQMNLKSVAPADKIM